MSTATSKQAMHSLTLIEQQNPSKEHYDTLHAGPLAALVKAAVRGTLPELGKLEKFLGLAEPVLMRMFEGEEIVLTATSGTRTIAEARHVFTGFLDSNFTNWGLDVPAKPTSTTPVAVHEMLNDASFKDIFGDFSQNLDDLCFTQDQIVSFVENHHAQLRGNGYATLFLFKVGGEYFVAFVSRGSGGRLSVGVCRFSYGNVWYAGLRHRVVVPQLGTSVT
ncbi:MAG: hypothetical protein AAB869_02470 [Patescibacteria group bacterium]